MHLHVSVALCGVVLTLLFCNGVDSQDMEYGAMQVRLAGGRGLNEGRVELFRDGRWVAICDRGFNKAAASVVCRRLGYPDAVAALPRSVFGYGNVSTWIVNLRCSGTEMSLDACPVYRPTMYDYSLCSYTNQAGVRCQIPNPAVVTNPPNPGSSVNVIVVGSGQTVPTANSPNRPAPTIASSDRPPMTSPPTGPKIRVDYYTGAFYSLEDGEWVGVCSKGWTMPDAIVACRQLNLGHPSRIGTARMTAIRKNRLANLDCNGDETSIHDCPYTVETCYTVAYLQCSRTAPDLTLDLQKLRTSIALISKPMHTLQCAVEERCLSATAYNPFARYGLRRLLIFTAMIFNFGNADLRPPAATHEWEWHACHRHFHSIQEFAKYDLLTPDGRPVGEGHKVSFCLRDDECPRGIKKYHCEGSSYGNQGISVGCGDLYDSSLDCQWIDVTDIPLGSYILRIIVNPIKLFAELNYDNNEVHCSVLITAYGAILNREGCWCKNPGACPLPFPRYYF